MGGVLALLAGLVGGFAWWAAPDALAVRTVLVEQDPTAGRGAAAVLNASGYVTARRRATVASKITGRLEEVSVEEGMPVREGQLLARIDDDRYRAALALAEARLQAARAALDETRAELELARRNVERMRRLAAAGVAGEAELDEVETAVDSLGARLARQGEEAHVAEREVALSRTELEDTVIRAPFAGVVISEDAETGEMVSPLSAGGGFTRTGIATIVDMGSLEIEVDVNESYISRVEPAQRVVAVLDAYPDWRIPAHVITTVPAADRQKATVLVRIGFDERDARILPDMGVQVTFLEAGAAEAARRTGDPAAGALLLPESAVRREAGRDVVFVVEGDRVERRAVALGAASGGRIEVRSGLAPGERVVVDPPPELADGTPVRVEDS